MVQENPFANKFVLISVYIKNIFLHQKFHWLQCSFTTQFFKNHSGIYIAYITYFYISLLLHILSCNNNNDSNPKGSEDASVSYKNYVVGLLWWLRTHLKMGSIPGCRTKISRAAEQLSPGGHNYWDHASQRVRAPQWKMPHNATKVPHAATKTWSRQVN